MSENGKRKLLVVDDMELNRIILKDLFENDFDVLEAEDGLAAMKLIEQYGSELSIILLDIVMPGMDGFEILKRMNDSGIIEEIPVIMITGENDEEKALRGYELGISDLVDKPFSPDIVYRRVNNVVSLYAHQQDMKNKLREQKSVLDKQAWRLRQSNQFIIDALSTIVEFRNLESGEHIKRVRAVTKILLEKASAYYPLTPEDIEAIASASAVHDIGKISIPDSILLKAGPLTPEEFTIMKTHTVKGCEILHYLNNMEDREYFTYCYDICRHHHERWDGRGYPDALKGDDIPIWAQATSVADVYDALTSKRVYKDAIPHEEAIKMILRGDCGVFNPKLLECLVNVQDTLCEQIKSAKETEMLLAAEGQSEK
ncbi:MAG: response regulator [Spirochaetaceae bacterium]|nr:response regulator [Spirochaetaceae bacterium]